jgi:hypothetical protein
VFNYLKLLKNQDNFNKWAMTNPDSNKEFKGTDGTVGSLFPGTEIKMLVKEKRKLRRSSKARRLKPKFVL